MRCRSRRSATLLGLGTASVLALTAALAVPAAAQDQAPEAEKVFHIPAQSLSRALADFSRQSDLIVVAPTRLTAGKSAPEVTGEFAPYEALGKLLQGSGLNYSHDEDGSITVVKPPTGKKTGSAAGPTRLAQVAETERQSDAGSDVEPVEVTEEDEEEGLENIVVTGTNIRGVAPDSSPSFTFDREDIAKSGVSTVSEFMQTLPQTFGGGAQADVTNQPNDRTASSNIGAGSSVNLRGLGANGTLILLNGRRLAASGSLGDFTDISMIPLSAIERIEVLTDGASAIYGADAIGGVVNIVLRSDYVGVESFLGVGTVTEGDLMEYRAGQTIGTAWGSGNALVAYEFYHRDNLSVLDREFSSVVVPSPSNNLFPEQQSHSVLLTATQELGDRVRIRGEASYSRRDVDTVIGPAVGSETLIATDNEQYGGAAGVDIGLWGDWRLDLAGSYNTTSLFREQTGFQTAQLESDSKLWSLDGKVDGSLFKLPGGNIKVAVGLGYREETFFFQGGATLREDERSIFGAFGEAFIPIVGESNRLSGVERLELTLAGRYDDYSDFGGTFNPKVGLLWSPVNGLRFRGTYSTSFNPPNLGDTGVAFGGSAFARNVPNPASPTMTSVAILTNLRLDLGPEESTSWTAGVDYSGTVGPGDFDLSVSWFDISYTDRIAFPGSSLFFLNDPVTFVDLITVDPDPAVTAEAIADAEFFLNLTAFPGFGPPVWMMPGDEEFILDGSLRNLTATDTSGLDVDLSYEVETGIGDLSFGLNGSYIFKQKQQITVTAPAVDVVDTIFNPADLRLRGSASWSNNGWSAAAFVNYVDGYVDDRNLLGLGDVPVSSWTTVDANLSYETRDRSGRNFTDNIRLSISVQNLFDKNPPTIESSSIFGGTGTGFDPTNADPLGRFVSFRVTKAW